MVCDLAHASVMANLSLIIVSLNECAAGCLPTGS
jgi:hypothetical protein